MTFMDQVNMLVSYAVGEGYTSTQAKNAPKSTYATILKIEENHSAWSGGNEGRFLNLRNAPFWSGFNIGYLRNLRRALIRAAQKRELEIARTFVETKLQDIPAYSNTFSSAEIIFEDRTITIWLDGIPTK